MFVYLYFYSLLYLSFWFFIATIVCMYLSIYLPTYLSIYLPIYLSIYLYTYRSLITYFGHLRCPMAIPNASILSSLLWSTLSFYTLGWLFSFLLLIWVSDIPPGCNDRPSCGRPHQQSRLHRSMPRLVTASLGKQLANKKGRKSRKLKQRLFFCKETDEHRSKKMKIEPRTIEPTR